MNKKIENILRHPSELLVTLDHRGFFNKMSDKRFLSLIGKSRLGKGFSLKNPKTFNEKLNWLKVHDHNPIYTQMADKYLVKSLVGRILEEKVNIAECYGVWNSFDKIDFELLPKRFVLKATHDSSGATICKDKLTFDKKSAKLKFDRFLSFNNYWGHREWVYKEIQPQIIAEELLEDGSGCELQDYKFWCFNGEPKIMYMTNKGENIYENFYDMKFNPVMIDHGFPRRFPEYTKPNEFDEMRSLATILSKNIPFVRVDFFDINGKIYFGEFTFYDWGGLRPFGGDWDMILGEFLDLPKV